MDSTFTAIAMLTVMLLLYVAMWVREIKRYKRNKLIKPPTGERQFVICAMERCKNCHNGNCLLKYISHDDNGRCQNYDYKSVNEWV